VLDNIRFGEAQMIASGVLMSVAAIAFSYTRPVDRLSPVRPLASIFHPAVAVSTLGQAAIHLACMVYAVQITRVRTEEEEQRIAFGAGDAMCRLVAMAVAAAWVGVVAVGR